MDRAPLGPHTTAIFPPPACWRSSEWPVLKSKKQPRGLTSAGQVGGRLGGRPLCARPVLPWDEASAFLFCCFGGRVLSSLLEQGKRAGSGPLHGAGCLYPQFLDLMETIEKQRKEMDRSGR